jgi:hypothetical protein
MKRSTRENGVADLVFLDSTNSTVGPISEVYLDKFVYDPAGGSSGNVVLNGTKGAFRFVTGSQDKRAIQVQTPFGSLGVRGTIVEMVLVPCEPGVPLTGCGAYLRLVYGAATLPPRRKQSPSRPAQRSVSTEAAHPR